MTDLEPLFNPFAAVPSMHVGLSALLAWSLASLVRPRALKGLLFATPASVLGMTLAVYLTL